MLSNIQSGGILASMSGQESGDQKSKALRGQYQALLEVTESIASHRDLSELFHDLARPLRNVLHFDYLSVRLHDPERNVMRIHILEKSAPGELVTELPVEGSLGGSVWQTQQALLIDDIEHEVRFPRAMQRLRANHIRSCCCLPLSTAHRRLGAMTIGSVREKAYRPTEFRFLEQVARQVAVAIDNALNFERTQSAQQQLTHERDRVRLLLEVNNVVVSQLDLNDLFPAVSACLRKVIQHDRSTLVLYDPETRQYRAHALHFANNESFIEEGRVESDGCMKSPAAIAITTRKPAVFGEDDLKSLCSESPAARRLVAEGVKAFCSLPLLSHDRILGAVNVGRRREDRFSPEDLELLSEVAKQIALAVENAQAYREISELKDRLAKENIYLEEEVRTEHYFGAIVGESAALRRVLKEVETVAPTGSTVLIRGETGTGKELVARALHDLSPRRGRTFVKLNCAAIPAGLLESELFGHEKGAFTGAIMQKVGRFELAHQGTLFLDEVGDIPLELQPKLLRALQEQEFERLGSTRTIHVDVRLVAATNRDLGQMVGDGRFRRDLYYRLNVFPVLLPPLRERRDDIPMLARHFTQQFAQRMGRRIEAIPAPVMEALVRYPWPGNIRELQNVIERAIIVSRGPRLQLPLSEFTQQTKAASADFSSGVFTLREAEREHILRALTETRWIIGGPAGAAFKLGMKRTTLQSRMRKLGITRPQ
ncbi:MAG TPA: sigma 54-interacting transcriptional regulator [Candidatus Binatia bacterium]|nr:sigma 54-interacting transcriptional regulator [Candidatus Binatia bacterium]